MESHYGISPTFFTEADKIMKIFKTTEYNIDASGIVDVTKELQHLIDLTAEENGMLILEKGTYLTSSLF